MNPAEDDDTTPSADEVLVAYLDGQLEADECDRIEARLATDASVRQRLQSLDRVWNALDALPRSTASATFTRTTVDMAAVSASQESGESRRRWKPPLWLLASGIGLIVGVLLTLALAGAPERNAINHLPALLNANALENAGSLDFLKLLNERVRSEGGRTSLQVFRTEEVQRRADQWDELTAANTAERRAWIAELPPDELTAVNSAVDRFKDRTAAKRDALRTLSRRIDEDDRAAELRETALVYQGMVGRLPQSEQARLRQMNDTERLEFVVGRARRWARDAALDLNDFQRGALRAEINRLVESDAYRARITLLAQDFPPFSVVTRREPRLGLLAASRFIGERGRRSRGPGPEQFRQALRPRFQQQLQRFEEEVVEAWSDWADRLTQAVPPATQDVLQEALTKGEDDRARLMHRLIRESLTEDLGDAFVSLPEEEMESLLLAPRDQFTERLSGQPVETFDLGRDPRGGGPPRGFGGRDQRSRRPGGDPPGGRFREGPPPHRGERGPFGPPGDPGDPPPPRLGE